MENWPNWAKELANLYLSGQSSMFLLHGNVSDLFSMTKNSSIAWQAMKDTLYSIMARTKQVIVYYDAATGLTFPDTKHKKLFIDIVSAARRLRGDYTAVEPLPRTASKVLPLLQDLISTNEFTSAVIINYLEALAPTNDIGSMNEDKVAAVLMLHSWATNQAFLETQNMVIMTSETLTEVSKKLLSAPSIATIKIDFPSYAERMEYLRSFKPFSMSITLESFARITAGLKLIQIGQIIRAAQISGDDINFASVQFKKKNIIEQECAGLVEFVPPRFNFESVGGMEGTKNYLNNIATDIKSGNTARVPMGMIFVGPMGNGKTFMAEAFAGSSGLTCIKLKNFRDKYVGTTESNLEKILTLVEALGNVLLIIDEADRTLSSGSDDPVGSRVIARLKEFMSNTAHRGHVVILMMTNRPDKLDVDLKRPGRFDIKIPFFAAETAEERISIMKAAARKNGISIPEGIDWSFVGNETKDYSSAELEQIVLYANSLNDQQENFLTEEHLHNAVKNVLPTRDTDMLKYMELMAVFECSSRTMLPPCYRNMSAEEVKTQLNLQKLSLHGRI